MLIDSHVHLYDKKFARDYERVLERADDAGVERMVCIGDRIDTSRQAIALAQRDPRISAVIGIHPHYDASFSTRALLEIEALARDPAVVAIGEIGLDYHYPGYDAKRQMDCFRAQGHLAARHGLPLVIHCRDAYDELIDAFQNDAAIQRRGVIHCFAGTRAQAEALLELGFYLGIGGAVTYPQAGLLREIVRNAGLDRLLIETDAPYLPPQAKRGRRNEPSYIKYAVQAVAELTGFTFQDVARATKANTIQCFDLPARLEPAVTYELRQNLYLCLTNRCPNTCSFCERTGEYLVKGHYLKLEHEPSAAELLAAVDAAGNASAWHEVVLAGLGEPTLRWDVALDVARSLKQRGARVRLNTNGQGNLLTGRDITPEMAGAFDAVAINLVAHDQATYNQIAKPELGDAAWPAVLEFTERCKKTVPDIALTIVALPEVDMNACRALAEDKLNVRLRVLE